MQFSPNQRENAMLKTLLIISAVLLSFPANAGTAFFVREIDTGGMTKQCVYDYLGSTYVITISSVRLCPLSIEV
jgi:hypothetical protein